MKDFSLQLFSLRDLPTLRERMEAAAAAGYTGVEFAGYDGIGAADMKQLLRELGLRGTGSHISYDLLAQDLDGCVRYCVEAGITSATCPGCDLNGYDTVMRQAAFLENCAIKFGEAGIPFAYHNHAQEFEPEKGTPRLELLMQNTEKLGFQLDVYWAAYAGVDPLAFIQKHAGRFPLLHFKELGDEKANVELGRGKLDFPALMKAGLAQGTREFIVEQEQYTMDPVESITVDAAYMKAL